MTYLNRLLKIKDITLPKTIRLFKAMVFPVVMYGCESWNVKKAECWRIDAFELWCWRRLESPLDCKEIQPVHPKGNQSWMFIGRTDVEAETPNTLATWCEELTHWKRPWCWERLKAGGEGMTKHELVGWHQQCSGYEFKQAPGVGDGQGSLAHSSPWDCKMSDTTEQLNWIRTLRAELTVLLRPWQMAT